MHTNGRINATVILEHKLTVTEESRDNCTATYDESIVSYHRAVQVDLPVTVVQTFNFLALGS